MVNNKGSAMENSLERTVDKVLETLPPVWDRIRSNLRTAATQRFCITLEQFHVLRHIRRGYRYVGDLAAKRQISRSAVSQAVEALVVKGLVTRTRETQDRRLVRLELTPYAGEVLESNFEANRAWMKQRMAALPRKELDIVLSAMEILKLSFGQGEEPRPQSL
jgi:DNA-binding MarR family transcriptional regulator